MTESNPNATPPRADTFTQPPPQVQWLVVMMIFVGYLALSLWSVGQKSLTFDEPGHITAGYSYWHRNDYRLMPENGNLPARWVALPLMFVRCEFSPPDAPEWVAANHIAIYGRFFTSPGTDLAGVVLAARFMAALVGAALGLVVFLWARSMMGFWGGSLALFLVAFSPAILGYGPLATSDMMATLFFLLAPWMLWLTLHRFTWTQLVIAGLSAGALMTSKMSSVVFLPMAALLAATCWWIGPPLKSAMFGVHRTRSHFGRAMHIAGVLVAIATITWVFIWAAYGFRYSATRPDASSSPSQFSQRWQEVEPNKGLVIKAVGIARELHALPEAYLFGIATVTQAMTRTAFMNGQMSLNGFLLFFPYTVLVKTPISIFILMGIGVWALARVARGTSSSVDGLRGWPALYDWIPLMVLWLVYWLFALTSNLNIGLRHVLPTYPAMCILGGAAAASLTTPKSRQRWPVIVLSGVVAVESVLMSPDHIAYCNVLAGGPSRAYRHLVDSSLDWGQDLPGLKLWLDQHRSNPAANEPIYFSYFGSAPIARYGVDAAPLPSFLPLSYVSIPPDTLKPGVYCISATMLQSICDLSGAKSHEHWTTAHETLYQSHRAEFDRIKAQQDVGATIRDLIARDGMDSWVGRSRRYEALRFARLCLHLRRREPDDLVGYTILIYRLSAQDLHDALDGPPAELIETPMPPRR